MLAIAQQNPGDVYWTEMIFSSPKFICPDKLFSYLIASIIEFVKQKNYDPFDK